MNELDVLYSLLSDMVENCEITEDSKLRDDLGLCSYDMMLLIALLEEKTGKKINLTVLKNDLTVKGLYQSFK